MTPDEQYRLADEWNLHLLAEREEHIRYLAREAARHIDRFGPYEFVLRTRPARGTYHEDTLPLPPMTTTYRCVTVRLAAGLAGFEREWMAEHIIRKAYDEAAT